MAGYSSVAAVLTAVVLITGPFLSQAMLISSQNVVKVSNSFACNLYQALAGKGGSSNIFFSPVSFSSALAMTFIGARGDTARQMSHVLQFDTLEESLLHPSFFFLLTFIYRADTTYTLKAANRLFGHNGLNLLPAFIFDIKMYYGAQMETLNFSSDAEGSRQHINSWVEKQTQDRIKDLLAPGAVDSLTRLVLVNAIYFKGDWARKFQTYATVVEKFHISASENIDVPMMHQNDKYNIARDESVSSWVLELPYIKDEVSMFIVLPDRVDGLADVQKKLSLEKIQTWVRDARNGRHPHVVVSLPKFTLQQDFDLNDVLKTMGMLDPFDENKADFSGMTGEKDLFISDVVHKAFLDVNEEGSEAAAATNIVINGRTGATRPLIFRAYHPFLMFIHDNQSGAVLFMGQLYKPSPA